jgi:hypothetical protein
MESAVEFDETCLETMDVPLLLAPNKAFEDLCKDSLLSESGSSSPLRHPVDVPVDTSDDDEDEWEFWDQKESRFLPSALHEAGDTHPPKIFDEVA